jgi:beta-glucanase (GH16 family)
MNKRMSDIYKIARVFSLIILSTLFIGSSGCKKTNEDDFTAAFSFEKIDDNRVKFINESTGEYYSLIWNFGNGESDTTTDKNKEYVIYYPFSGDYTTTLTLLNYTGAKSETNSKFNIAENDLTISFTAEIDGSNPNYVNLTNTTQGNYDSFSWVFLDQIVENEEQYQAYFPYKGVYDIELVVVSEGEEYIESTSVTIAQDDSGNIPGLIWSDEFDYTGLPTSAKWNMETGGNGWGNNELQYYTNREVNASVADGVLTITAQEEDYGGRAYTSARITTQNKFDVQYGKIEARIKLPYGQGIWPAFWMLGANIGSVGWPACGEIDIMEMVGGTNRDNTIYSTLHWQGADGHAEYGEAYSLNSGIFADDFHVFSVIWDDQHITGYVDDIEYFIIDITPAQLSEFHQNFFIILNVAVGGNWPGSPDETTVFPQTMQVDYVRVYSLD